MKKYKEFKTMLVESLESDIPKENRTLSNLPKYADKKPKIPIQKWLGIKSNGGQGYDKKYYGWSHRAIAGFGVGDNVEGDSMAHKDYKWNDSDAGIKHSSYKIKTDAEAKEHAIRFMDAVS